MTAKKNIPFVLAAWKRWNTNTLWRSRFFYGIGQMCVCVRLLDANHFNNRNHVALANELKILEGELVIRKFAVLGKTEKKDQNTKWHFE